MVRGLLIVVASLVKHRLWSTQASVAVVPGLSSRGSQALEHRLNSCGALSRSVDPSGIKPVSPA